MIKKHSIGLICLLFLLPTHAAVWTITYPKSPVENDVRFEYPVALLELALQKTGVRYELKPSTTLLHQAKAMKRLEENVEINLLWSMTDTAREAALRPIRIPITRGLIGWRVFLTHKNSDFRFADIDKMEDLLKYSPIQGIDWPDTKILQANGFNVVTSRDYVEATELMNNQLGDFFPRSIIEALPELENKHSRDLRLRDDLAFYYPAAQYFFTNIQNVTLANLIETGLRRAIADGSYEALFNQHYGDTIKALNIENTRYFRLANPLLPELTPLGDPVFWYYPVGDAKQIGESNATQGINNN